MYRQKHAEKFVLLQCCAVAVTLTSLIANCATADVAYTGEILYPLTPPSGTDIYELGGQQTAETARGGQTAGTDSANHAVVWPAGGGAAIDLNPSAFFYSQAFSTDGTQQVGYGEADNGRNDALLWSGTAGSFIDLNPAGFIGSQAYGVGGSQQIGFGFDPSDNRRALMWSGTAASAVDLTPAGALNAYACGTDGSQQVGTDGHALLWSGSAASVIDLGGSGALGVGGGQQVGYGLVGGYNHALLWFGTAASVVDLNPSGFLDSVANGTNGIEQVGSTDTDFEGDQAELWSGTAASAVDLQSLLPTGIGWQESTAWTIDSAGNVYGTADGFLNAVSTSFAVEWSPVPEPGSIALLTVGTLGLYRRPKRNPSDNESAPKPCHFAAITRPAVSSIGCAYRATTFDAVAEFDASAWLPDDSIVFLPDPPSSLPPMVDKLPSTERSDLQGGTVGEEAPCTRGVAP